VSLTPGARVGPYDIAEPIGVGGMGEVYRATDTNLKRSVAIKVLPSSVAFDAERLARFQREAEVVAALNHPNIAAIYGFEKASGLTALVLELVEGPTLADRIAQGPMPIDEVLPIATQIAAAIAAAHGQNIVHRDLKPSNIKVRPDGTVKVLDFGLAKAMESTIAAATSSSSMSPTITTPAMTQAGMILGTAAYMSPEQAKGRAVDRRSDVWAFGCIVYEMLTGRRAFEGEDVTDTIAAVVRGEPDWQALPAHTPPQIRLMLKRSLVKDRHERLADISVAMFLMTETIAFDAQPTLAPAAVRPGRAHTLGAWLIGVLVGAVLVAAAFQVQSWFKPLVRRTPVRFTLSTPSGQTLAVAGVDHDVAISADGSQIVYRSASTGTVRLVARALDELEVRPIAGTALARNPFLSPDGRWVGFFVGDELRKVMTSGGPAITLCKVGGAPRGASWGEDDVIVFAVADGNLRQVPAGGGDPKTLIEATANELHSFPHVLPGAGAVIFTVRTRAGDATRVEVFDRRTGQRKMLVTGGHDAVYAGSGHLVFVVGPQGNDRAGGTLRAMRFDLKRLQVAGDQVPVLDPVAAFIGSGAGDYALSRSGTLVYLPGDPRFLSQTAVPRTLTWVTRQGKEEPIPAPERSYAVARIAPDGTRVALDIRDQTMDIWVFDLNRKTLTPLSRDPAQDMSPVWTPDGRRVIWTSTRGGGNPNLYWQDWNGTGTAERLSTGTGTQFPTSVAPDGTHLVLFGGGPVGTALLTVPLGGADHKAVPLLQSTSIMYGGEISPDGRWLAYHSNESGQFQVYVRPYPNVEAGRWPISTNGGSRAAWATSGRELFYLDERGMLTSVAVRVAGGAFSASAPQKILNTAYYLGASLLNLDLRAYDVSHDGQRFLMIKDVPSAPQPSAESQPNMVVVVNWFEELKAMLPAK